MRIAILGHKRIPSREGGIEIVLESKTYECICDFEAGMWREGPDYFRDTLRRTEKKVG